MMPAPTFTVLAAEGAQRTVRASWPREEVAALTYARIEELGRAVRLPGFRPGKIPAEVLVGRYGRRAHAEVVARLTDQAAAALLAQGTLASTAEAEGDLAVRFTCTHLPDLPAFDPAALTLERLTCGDPALAPGLEEHLRRQILDRLDDAFDFPVAASLVDREFAAIRAAVEDDVPEEAAAELRLIAERRVRLGAVLAELARRNALHVAAAMPAEREPALEAAVIAWILGHARVTKRPATPAEIAELSA